jgi:hypothetical protein
MHALVFGTIVALSIALGWWFVGAVVAFGIVGHIAYRIKTGKWLLD